MTGERRGWLSTSSTGDRERGSWARWGNKRVEPEEALYMPGRCEEFGEGRQWLVEWGVDVGSWWGQNNTDFWGKPGEEVKEWALGESTRLDAVREAGGVRERQRHGRRQW